MSDSFLDLGEPEQPAKPEESGREREADDRGEHPAQDVCSRRMSAGTVQSRISTS